MTESIEMNQFEEYREKRLKKNYQSLCGLRDNINLTNIMDFQKRLRMGQKEILEKIYFKDIMQNISQIAMKHLDLKIKLLKTKDTLENNWIKMSII